MNWEWPRHEKDGLPPSPPRFARFGSGSLSPTPPPTAEPRAENVALSDTSEPRAANVALSDTFADTENDDFDVRALEDEKAEHFLDGDELPQLSVPRNEAPVFRSGVQVVLRDDEAAPGTDWLCCGGGGGGVNDITAAQLCMGSGPGMTYDDAMIPPPGAVLGSPRHPVEFAPGTPDSTPPRVKEAAKRNNYQPPKRAKPEDPGIQWT